MSEVILGRVIQTCYACPSQWNAWDIDGNYWYLRYRHGVGTAERQPNQDFERWEDKPPNITFTHGDGLDGTMGLREFCRRAGLHLAPDAAIREL
jgi:hypothetical protein